MQQMQYIAPNRMYVYQILFPGVTPNDPHLVLGHRIGPLSSKILVARLIIYLFIYLLSIQCIPSVTDCSLTATVENECQLKYNMKTT